jgi:hypothetical protein
MIRRLGSCVLPIVCLALVGCAEGGSRGSGIATELAGNVARIDPLGPSLAGIRVSVEGTSVHGSTDAAGAFTMRGDFDGRNTVVFTLPRGGGTARLAINVPANGQLTLENVIVDASTGDARAEHQTVAFDGVVVGVDCPHQTVTFVSSHTSGADRDEYVLHLENSVLEDSDGTPVACTAVAPGTSASVVGAANTDGTFADATVVLDGATVAADATP